MTNQKFKNVKFKFPKDPMNTEFMKIWHETIEREDFKRIKMEAVQDELQSIMNNFNLKIGNLFSGLDMKNVSYNFTDKTQFYHDAIRSILHIKTIFSYNHSRYDVSLDNTSQIQREGWLPVNLPIEDKVYTQNYV